MAMAGVLDIGWGPLPLGRNRHVEEWASGVAGADPRSSAVARSEDVSRRPARLGPRSWLSTGLARRGRQICTLRNVRSRWVPVVVAACLAASGCSGAKKGSPRVLPSLTTPSHTTGPTPLTSTTPAKPIVVPSPARPATPQGAAAFIKFYLGQVSAAYATADPGLLAGLSDVECATCARYADSARSLRLDGKHIVGQSVVVISVEAPAVNGGYVAADVFFDVPSRAVSDGSGHILERLGPRPRAHQTFFIHRRGESWSVRAVKRAA